MYAKAASKEKTIPKAHCLFVWDAAVVCPRCWSSVELNEMEVHAGHLRMLQNCPTCGEMFHIEHQPKVEIV